MGQLTYPLGTWPFFEKIEEQPWLMGWRVESEASCVEDKTMCRSDRTLSFNALVLTSGAARVAPAGQSQPLNFSQ
jgi:hypothetical protein